MAADEGRIEEAITYYHRAMYGRWPSNEAEHRVQTHIELVEALGKVSRNKQAQAELLSLIQEVPIAPGTKMRVARLLLALTYRKSLPKYFAMFFNAAGTMRRPIPA